MKGVKEFYDKTALDWSEDWLEEKKSSNICKTFYDLFALAGTVSPRILDAGSGLGYDCKILSDYGCDVTGVDFSEKSIEISQKNIENCSFFVRDISSPLGILGKFDGIICLGVINYIDILNGRKVFENFSAVLKKGGLAMVSCKDGNGKNEEKSMVILDGDVYDLGFYEMNAEQLCSLALPDLRLVDTFRFDDFSGGWKYYVFTKI